ncbi:PhoH family protein, partial [Myxococcota bacterium]|nr:PhoH family protein [Myxococcota bacterium]
MTSRIFTCPNQDTAIRVFGVANRHLNLISQGMDLSVSCRGTEATFSGSEKACDRAVLLLGQMLASVEKGFSMGESDIETALRTLHRTGETDLARLMDDVIVRTYKGSAICPKTAGQQQYINAMRRNTLVFGIGPAGTGKTYLAMALALAQFSDRKVSRIILTRPAVEAGEKLGFLPGDLEQKVNPYLRPLYDALNEIYEPVKVRNMMSEGLVEVAPLAFMRGRTLKNAFIILDEAQNTTREQMKMFLTRIGDGSRCVVTGDITQIDLPDGRSSGLVEAVKILRGVEDIAIHKFEEFDVIRHPLVRRIISAYDKLES